MEESNCIAKHTIIYRDCYFIIVFHYRDITLIFGLRCYYLYYTSRNKFFFNVSINLNNVVGSYVVCYLCVSCTYVQCPQSVPKHHHSLVYI